jgi:transcription elongation factor Elf1
LSSSQLTSHFTSMEGPPKVYEEIMRNLEADVRKHIRIEHQLKLHIESVEDRVEELEREADQYDEFIDEYKEIKKEIKSLKKELNTKGEMLEVKEILIEKLTLQVNEIEKDHSLKNENL